jgi:hypothetical protein
MHAEPTHCPRTVPLIENERTVMMVLLSESTTRGPAPTSNARSREPKATHWP